MKHCFLLLGALPAFPERLHGICKAAGCFAVWALLLAGFSNPDASAQQTPNAPGNAPASAAPADALKGLWQEGTEAFNQGKFDVTIAKFTTLIAQAPEGSELDSVYYTLGAAYFNAQDFNSAASTFATLLKLYPKTSKALDVSFSMANAYLFAGKHTEATALLKQLESFPQFKEQIPLLLANASKGAQKPAEAIAILENLLQGGIQSTTAAKGAMMLVELYVETREVEKAANLLVTLNRQIGYIENVAALNPLAVRIGDKCLELKKNRAALGCYRLVRSKEVVQKIQGERIAAMERQYAANQELLPKVARELDQIMALNRANTAIQKEIGESRALLEQFEKLPPIQPPIYLRIASAFVEDGKRWEALVVYDELMKRFPQAPERESALYASLVITAEFNLTARCLALCDEYLKCYPKGKELATVYYLQGSLLVEKQQFAKAESFFGSLVKEYPKHPLAETVPVILGNSKFQQGKFLEAAAEYSSYIEQFPQGKHIEEVDYRNALAVLLGGDLTASLPLIEGYLTKYPNGFYVPDALYRKMVCLYASKEYDKVLEATKDWEAKFGMDQQLGEVLALQADVLAAREEFEPAIETYIRSYKCAANEEVLNYSLFEASKLLQKRGQWEQISALFEEFVKEKPEHPMVTTALYWIGRAKAKLGKNDEAKAFLAETANRFLDDPKREAVEQIISQLALLCTKRKAPAPTDPAASGTAAPEEIGAELERLLVGGTSATAKARILYAKAELSRLRKQPEKEGKHLLEISSLAKPQDLSPLLLGLVSERLLAKKSNKEATEYLSYLLAAYPKSDLVDYAYLGLGDLAFAAENYTRALSLYQDGIESSPAGLKIKELTVGQGRARLAMNQLEEAKMIFLEIAGRREWRGEATATAVFSLGEIEMKNQRYAEAIAYYQRVYVAYRKYLPWVAKAYIQSADCFLKLGKSQEATNTYRELLRNEKLLLFPEAEIARKAVQSAGGGQP